MWNEALLKQKFRQENILVVRAKENKTQKNPLPTKEKKKKKQTTLGRIHLT